MSVAGARKSRRRLYVEMTDHYPSISMQVKMRIERVLLDATLQQQPIGDCSHEMSPQDPRGPWWRISRVELIVFAVKAQSLDEQRGDGAGAAWIQRAATVRLLGPSFDLAFRIWTRTWYGAQGTRELKFPSLVTGESGVSDTSARPTRHDPFQAIILTLDSSDPSTAPLR